MTLKLKNSDPFEAGKKAAIYTFRRGAVSFDGWGTIIRPVFDIPGRYLVRFGDTGPLVERFVHPGSAQSDVLGFLMSMNSMRGEIIASLFDAMA